MKYLKVVLAIILFTFYNYSFSQIDVSATVGAATPILNNGTGIQIGINPSMEVTDYFSIEGQASYIHVDAKGFLSGEDVTMTSFNALAGGRLYFLNSEKSFRPYFNLLAGINHHSEQNSPLGIGLTLGLYGEVNDKFLIGVATESYSFIIGKVGYQF